VKEKGLRAGAIAGKRGCLEAIRLQKDEIAEILYRLWHMYYHQLMTNDL